MWNEFTNGCYIVGVSGGPDSMALVQMCIQHNIKVVVAHVNYDKRDTAKRDEEIVRHYCEAHEVPMYVIYPIQDKHENFQAWARDVRYAFYERLYLQYNAQGLLLGHQMDDVLETYHMQIERASYVREYGIASKTQHGLMQVYRPLLSYRKCELQAYCDTHQIPYGIDESNLTDHYTRNRIRHRVIEHATDKQCKEWLKEIEIKNAQKKQHDKKVQERLEELLPWDMEKYRNIEDTLRYDVLREWLLCQGRFEAYEMSLAYIEELDGLCRKEENFRVEITKGHWLEKDYGVLTVQPVFTPYAYEYKSIKECETPFFSIRFDKGKTVERVHLSQNDFPITIRSAQKGDVIQMRYGKKRVSRWFIDRKIPVFEREKWPVVVNKDGDVVLVPGIGCDVMHYDDKEGIFVVK